MHVAQAQARLADRTINLRRAEIDRAQRTAEIASQKLRLKAEQDDLAERIELNEQIRAVHDYKARFAGTVELHTYAGAFVEKGDPICTLRR